MCQRPRDVWHQTMIKKLLAVEEFFLLRTPCESSSPDLKQ
jgi:hypothetical protein